MSEPHFNGPLAHLVRRIIIHSPPDPWSPEIDAEVKARDAVPLCPDCLHPQAPAQWFCPHCNYPTGDFVPMLPYQSVFCIGEVARRGVSGPGKNTLFQTAGFALFGFTEFAFFAPIYWFWLARKADGLPICEVQRRPLADEPAAPESDPDA